MKRLSICKGNEFFVSSYYRIEIETDIAPEDMPASMWIEFYLNNVMVKSIPVVNKVAIIQDTDILLAGKYRVYARGQDGNGNNLTFSTDIDTFMFLPLPSGNP